jgi:hypothetical protein
MSLAVHTDKGRSDAEMADVAAELWLANNPGWSYVRTNTSGRAKVDGLIVKDGELRGVVESKCRNIDLKKFSDHEEGGYESQWLVTLEKLIEAKDLANLLQVPLVGFLYLKGDGVLLTKVLAKEAEDNPNAYEFVANMVCRKSETKKTTNGGLANRCNAYLDMSDAKEYRD